MGSAIGGVEIWGDPPDQWEELVAADNVGYLERVSKLEVQIWPMIPPGARSG